MVLAEPLDAGEVVPPFDNTAVDGYAVRSADVAEVPVELVVVGEIAAGRGPGSSRRSRRGDPHHDGRPDARGRRCRGDGGGLRTRRQRPGASVRAVPVGASIRRAGDDVRIGDSAVRRRHHRHPGRRRRARERQCADGRGVPAGRVSRSCRRATNSSTTAHRSSWVRSARATRRCWRRSLAEAGCDVVDLGIVPDDEDELERVLRRGGVRLRRDRVERRRLDG